MAGMRGYSRPKVMRRLMHILSTVLIAAVVLATAADAARAADACASVLAKPAEHPACCKDAGALRISAPGENCCAKAEIAAQESAVPGSGAFTDVPPAPAVRLVLRQVAPVHPAARALGLAPRPLGLARPPDRRPPTDTTVLLR